MKKLILTLLNLLFLQNIPLFSDNWEPFPLNQISYYKITEVTKTQEIVFYEEEDLIGSIGIINFDSCFIQSENRREYFSKKLKFLKPIRVLFLKQIVYKEDTMIYCNSHQTFIQ